MQANEPKQDNKQEGKFFKKKVIIPIVAAGIIAAGTAYMFSPPPKIELREKVSRGQYMQKFIDEKNNSFHDYLIASRLFQKIDDEELRKELDNLTRTKEVNEVSSNLREYIQQNQPAINMIETGIAKNNYVAPEYTSFVDLMPYFSSYRGLAITMVASAKIKEIDGNIKGAYDEYFKTMRLAQDCSKDRTLVGNLVNMAIDGLAIEAMQPNLKNLDNETLETVISRLKEVEDNFTPLSETLKKENKGILDMAEYVMKTGYIGAFSDLRGRIHENESNLKCNALRIYSWINKSRINRNLENYMQNAIKFVDEPLRENEEKEFEEKYVINKDYITRTLTPAVSMIKSTYGRFKTGLRGTRLRAAVELYQNKYNQLPNNLQDLVDVKIIEQVPIDPFSNQPFKYLNKENKIYSIGPDFKDDEAKIEFNKGKENKRLGDMIF